MSTAAPSISSYAPPAGTSRLLQGIYRDIGMAAVALGLEITVEGLDRDSTEAVRRGSRYLDLMPRRREAAPAPAAH